VVTQKNVIDWTTRLGYLQTALRLKGLLGAEAPEEPEPEKKRRVSVHINMACDQCPHCTQRPKPVGAGTPQGLAP
jgi:hypothetical protein